MKNSKEMVSVFDIKSRLLDNGLEVGDNIAETCSVGELKKVAIG
jgi:hypothetical protein